MKTFFSILFLYTCLFSYAQRPDLTIGVNASMKYLNSGKNSSTYISPGGDMALHVTKRQFLGGINLGYSAVLNENQLNFTPHHHLNIDLVGGLLMLRKPTTKIGLNAILSNRFALAKENFLQPNSLFSRYSFQILPEVFLRYKYLRLAVNYRFPIVGTRLYGPGISIGIAF